MFQSHYNKIEDKVDRMSSTKRKQELQINLKSEFKQENHIDSKCTILIQKAGNIFRLFKVWSALML